MINPRMIDRIVVISAAMMPIIERVAAAVEQPHHDVAAVAVRAQEELAVGLEPLRADRHAVEADDVLRLPSTVIVSDRWFVSTPVFATLSAQIGATTQARTSTMKSAPKNSATLLRFSRRSPSCHGPSPWTCSFSASVSQAAGP